MCCIELQQRMGTCLICEKTGKVCYEKKEIYSVLSFGQKVKRYRGKKTKYIPNRAYKCEFCGMYHTTNVTKKRRIRYK